MTFRSRQRMIGRVRFFHVWALEQFIHDLAGTPPAPDSCRSARRPIVRDHSTIHWFLGSANETVEALATLGRRQSEMLVAAADARRSENADLLSLQKSLFGEWLSDGYRTALGYLVGPRSSPPFAVHATEPLISPLCYHEIYRPEILSDLSDGSPSGWPLHGCFQACTVDAARPDVALGIGLIRANGPLGEAAMAAAVGRTSLGELGVTSDAYNDALLYMAQDASVAAFYPDGYGGKRIPFPSFIFRTQMRGIQTSLPASVSANEWDELSVTELLEWVDSNLDRSVRSAFTAVSATPTADAEEALAQVAKTVDAQLGKVSVVVGGHGLLDELIDVTVRGLASSDLVTLVRGGASLVGFGPYEPYVCALNGFSIRGVPCSVESLGSGVAVTVGCSRGSCRRWRNLTQGFYFLLLNGKPVAMVDGAGMPTEWGAFQGERVTRVGGEVGAAVDRLTAINSRNCSSLQNNSTGVAWNLVPPLENSLISDSDPYEDSFDYYLTAAEEAGRNAVAAADAALRERAALAESAVDSSAELENAAADEQDQLAELCGAGRADCTVPRATRTLEQMGLFGEIPALPSDEDCQNASATAARVSADDWQPFLDSMGLLVRCAAAKVVNAAASTRVVDLPVALDDAVLTDAEGALFGGSTRAALTDIQLAINDAKLAVESLRSGIEQIGITLRTEAEVLTQLDDTDAIFGWTMLKIAGNLLSTCAASCGAADVITGACAGGTLGAFMSAAADMCLANIEAEHGRARFGEAVSRFEGTIRETISSIRSLGIGLDSAFQRVVGGIARLDNLVVAATAATARREGLQAQVTASYEEVRGYHNLLLARATREAGRAIDDGIRKAFVARRAVEFRIGIDLSQERGRHTFVEPPQSWANDIFRITAADSSGEGGEGGDGGAPMADLDLADYVNRLRLYVQSYPFDHPFTDGRDIAVVSLRDDVIRAKPECGTTRVGHNLLLWSEAFERETAWTMIGTGESGMTTPPGDLPTEFTPYAPARLFSGEWVYQDYNTNVDSVGDEYHFSVWVHPAASSEQLVGLAIVSDEPPSVPGGPSPAISDVFTVEPLEGWRRVGVTFRRTVTAPARLRAWIFTSGGTPWTQYPVWVWGTQLEHGPDPLDGYEYEATMSSRLILESLDEHANCRPDVDETGHVVDMGPPTDWDGSVFRTAFSVVCADGTGPMALVEEFRLCECGAECPAPGGGEPVEGGLEWAGGGLAKCVGEDAAVPYGELACRSHGGVEFFTLPFSFHQARVASGDLFAEESFATGNYNYRIDDLAFNLVPHSAHRRSDFSAIIAL